MRSRTLPFLICLIINFSCKQKSETINSNTVEHDRSSQNAAYSLVAKMVAKVGSMDKLKALKDVEYKYTFRDVSNNVSDVSTERYIFEGEQSWAQYDHHTFFIFPNEDGLVIQGYDGKTTWTSLNNKIIETPEAIRLAYFFRKTNFYWFTMMPKLLDEGLEYELLDDRIVNDINYKIVKVTFKENVGDVQDEYILYINPLSYLVDQFLFTVKSFNQTAPFLMQLEYEVVEGIHVSTKRRFTNSDWQGKIVGEKWSEQTSEQVKFNNEFDESLFNVGRL